MELKGTKIVFLGDSITEGRGASCPENVYWRVFARLSGAECCGNGIGGSRIAPQRKATVPAWDRYFGSRLEELPRDADIAVVFGGTNDFGHGDAALGELSDRTEDSFYGALHVLCQRLLERYPQVVLLTPLHRTGEDNVTYNRFGIRRCAPLERYVDAIRQVGGWYGIPVLDLYRTSGLQPDVEAIRERYMPDGVHPSDAGHLRIAQRLMGFLRTL